jgi:hypothetical protein
MSSSFNDATVEEPFCERMSVDVVPALPLRFLILYFSIASASRSNIRVAIGDNALDGLAAECGIEYVLALPTADNPYGCEEFEEPPMGRWASRWDGEVCGEFDSFPTKEGLSRSLSEVAVRLPPDPLRIRKFSLPPRYLGGIETGDGIIFPESAGHSVPLSAACAKTCLLMRLLFSNWARAVSCNVSRVFDLADKQSAPILAK